MSRRIMAELPNDFIRRMQNWARWSARGGYAQISPSSMWSAAPSGTRGNAAINTLGGEAEDTDKAFNAVPVRYRQAVMLFWQYENQPMTYLARRCGGIDYRTYEDRVIEGPVRLRAQIAIIVEKAREDRMAFERLVGA